MGKVTTYAELKARKKPVTRKVYIALDDEKADEFNKIAMAYRDAKQSYEAVPDSEDIRKEFRKAEAAYEAALEESEEFVVEFVVRSIGREPFEQLMSSCPPTPEQKKEAKAEGEDEPAWNPDTFMPSLIAASLVVPEITEEEVFEMWSSGEWNLAELMSIFMAALQVNQTRKTIDLGKESGQTPDFGLS